MHSCTRFARYPSNGAQTEEGEELLSTYLYILASIFSAAAGLAQAPAQSAQGRGVSAPVARGASAPRTLQVRNALAQR